MAFAEAMPYGARDDIARRELSARHILYETHARLVDQCRALAAHRLADQDERMAADIERRRVKLHEFHVDERRAGTRCERQTLTERSVGIRGVQEQADKSAGRQHDAAGRQQDRFIGGSRKHAADYAVGDQQPACFHALQHGDRRRSPHRRPEWDNNTSRVLCSRLRDRLYGCFAPCPTPDFRRCP
jgi:hypothetical protein